MIFLFPNEVTDISKILYTCEVTSKLNKKSTNLSDTPEQWRKFLLNLKKQN